MSDQTNTSSTDQSQGVAGVGMFVAAYVDELAAEQVLENMKQAKKSGELYYEDAAVIRQDPHGKVHIKETNIVSLCNEQCIPFRPVWIATCIQLLKGK